MALVTLPSSPQRIAAETFLVPTFAPEPSGAYVSAHSLVIRGREPVVIDTGVVMARGQWLEQLASVVDPADVRWIVLSHDDHDHIGNVEPLLDLAPQATLVINFGMAMRLAGSVELPMPRMRWIDPGGRLDVGDRVLRFVRPPLFDSPATRGVFDPVTGALWAVDTFGALVQGEVYEAGDVPAELYEASFAAMNSWNTPWLEWVDEARFGEHVRATASLPLEVVASAHGPLLRGGDIAAAFARTAALVGQPPVPQPGQELLDALLAAALAPAAT